MKRRSPSRKWSRHPGPSVAERALALLRTAGPDGPVAWTTAELAEGTGAYASSVADSLHQLEAAGQVERAGHAIGRWSRPIRLWRAVGS